MTPSDWVGVAGIVAAPLLGIAVWIIGLGNRLTKLETQMTIFWKDVSFDAARILHSPDPSHWRMDELIELYLQGMASLQERQEIADRLKQTLANVAIDRGERMTASTMLRALKARYDDIDTHEENGPSEQKEHG
jgi:hypothetical protein